MSVTNSNSAGYNHYNSLTEEEMLSEHLLPKINSPLSNLNPTQLTASLKKSQEITDGVLSVIPNHDINEDLSNLIKQVSLTASQVIIQNPIATQLINQSPQTLSLLPEKEEDNRQDQLISKIIRTDSIKLQSAASLKTKLTLKKLKKFFKDQEKIDFETFVFLFDKLVINFDYENNIFKHIELTAEDIKFTSQYYIFVGKISQIK